MNVAYILNTYIFVNPNCLRFTITRNLQYHLEQYWHYLLDDASKAIIYRLFKDYFGMEVYFDILDNKNVVELEQQIINYLLKLADGITPIDIT